MLIQSRHETFNISYCELIKKFFITSKSEDEGRPEIGAFRTAGDAIEFALNRVS